MMYEESLLALNERIRVTTISHPILSQRVQPYLDALKAGKQRLETPTMLTWNLTKSCNLTCTYCAVDARFGSVIPNQNDVNKQILNKVLELSPMYVSLLGGEPTLATELPEIVNALSSARIFVDITTNGARVSDDLIESLINAQESGCSIMISLDSFDRSVNDSRRGKGSFSTATRAAKRLADAGIPFSIGMTISKSNLHHVLPTYLYAADIGASLFCSWFVMPSGKASKCEATLPDSVYVEQVHEILDRAEENFLPVGRMDLSYATARILSSNAKLGQGNGCSPMAEVASKVSCEGCRYRALIDENGDVFPCDFLQYDVFRMGNLLSDNWADIWYSRPARFKASLTRSNKPGCKECEAQFCDTGCFGVSFANYLETGHLVPMCEVLV